MIHFVSRLLGIVLMLFLVHTAHADEGYQIEINIDGFTEQQCYLANYYGDKQYIQDTANVENGKFLFKNQEELPEGIYLVILPPDNKYFEVLLKKGEQHFSVFTKMDDFVPNMRIEGSPDNKLFYEYLNFIGGQRQKAEALEPQIKDATGSKKKSLQEQQKTIGEAVKAKQTEIIKQYPDYMTSTVIKSSQDVIIPDAPEGMSDEDKQLFRFNYYKKHYFDNIDLTSDRILRTPLYHKKLMQYVEKLTVQHPDSVNISVDYVLQKTLNTDELFKYTLVTFLNKYAKSKVVGMDAVYVHIAENYYAKNLATWTDPDQLDKIISNAKNLKPLLVGKVAPDLAMQTRDNKRLYLHDVEAKYTVLLFWDPECGHCKKAMPHIVDFYKAHQNNDVKIYSVCTKHYQELDSCWEQIKEHNMEGWIHVVDPYYKSRFRDIYDIKATPVIFVLDENKKIVSKRIGGEQLSEVLENLYKIEKIK